MSESLESELIEWLTAQPGASRNVQLGIGDDMAIVDVGGRSVAITTDMLLDGVHFDRNRHTLEEIGRKAIACSLSDCAAMAVKPLAATVSVALPESSDMNDAKALHHGMRAMADAFDCVIVGGDTTGWDQRLAIDVTILALPYATHPPVRRDTARVGDVLFVTGPLGGSILGRHMNFTPRVHEAHGLVDAWGSAVHALMDISDGLAIDLHRMCKASNVGALLEERLLEAVISDDARELAHEDGKTPVTHALSDGEDYELLLAAKPDQPWQAPEGVSLFRIGTITDSGMMMRGVDGNDTLLSPMGYEHL